MGKFTLPLFERLLDFINANLPRGQGLRVHLDAHGIFLAAEHLHLRHAVDRRDALGDQRLRVFVHRGKRQRRRSQHQKETG